jgi:hypothetical protein
MHTTTTQEITTMNSDLTTPMIDLHIPYKFFRDTYRSACFIDFQDDQYRELCDRIGKANRIKVSLSERDALELVSRAEHYADPGSGLWEFDGGGMVRSARATLKAIAKTHEWMV